MDPDATYKLWLRTSGEERDEARENLLTWIRNGGFEPAWTSDARKQFFANEAP